MQQHKDLYLATSLEALNRIALLSSKKTAHLKKPETLLNLAKKLYNKGQSDPYDEEMSYILLQRFLVVYEQLVKVSSHDTIFVTVMLGKEADKAKAQLNDLRNNLINRYEKAALTVALAEPHSTVPVVAAKKRTTVFDDATFITCPELFRAFCNKNVNILVMDARNANDFQVSHIKDVHCINIPEACIQSGLSAHKLGQSLPTESIESWEKRDTFDVIVLLDWNTSRTTFTASKLDKLRTILTEWDINKFYNEKPCVLDCGYIEWLEMYPMFCTRPDIRYFKANTELDELLNLDSIEYPTDSESKSHEVFNQQLAKQVTTTLDEMKSRQEILQEEKLIIEKNKDIATEILKREKLWKDLHEQISNEYDLAKLERLKIEEAETENQITKLIRKEANLVEKKSKLATDFNLSASFNPSEGQPDSNMVDLGDIKKLQKEHLDIVKARQALSKDRQRLLDEARQAKKPKISAQSGGKNKKPAVNRASKPKTILPKYVNHMDGQLKSVQYGLTGLYNIRNTCYMNTTIQCLRHIPDVLRFFCTGEYIHHMHPKPRITKEVAHVIRSLWSNSYAVIKPTDLYNKFISLAVGYKGGNHEDCMEFFLQLFSYLNEDCAFEIKAKNYWSETQIAWFKQHGGKVSFYINNFYHQIKYHQFCRQCHVTSLRFDIENVFYLTVPNKDFSLEECMNAYLKNVDQHPCKKCKSAREVKKTITCYPRILVIALKRYLQSPTNQATFKKNERNCSFPTDNFMVGNCAYKLNAVAMHTGDMHVGHYTAACLNPINNTWYMFNDERTTPLDVTDSFINKTAYAFFYSLKCDNVHNFNMLDGQKMYEESIGKTDSQNMYDESTDQKF